MIKRSCIIMTLLLCAFFKAHNVQASISFVFQQDTIDEFRVSAEALKKINTLNSKSLTSDSVHVEFIKKNPYVHIGDYLKGNVSGVYVQTPSAEPGNYQNVIVRGLSKPLLNNNDINSSTAAVYVNGVPMTFEHNFSNGLQRYDITRIGASTDYYSTLDLSTIQSIELIKDPVRLNELGPLAVNGVVWITTYGGVSSPRLISINSYYGFNTKPVITPLNADYENRFRKQFYNKYPSEDPTLQLRYPGYLSDSTNIFYYGPSNWMDEYYSTAALSNIDVSIRGGTTRANFGLMTGFTNNAIASDDVSIKKYNVLFNINMLPYEWMNVSSYINARRIARDRNKNIRDRLLEMAYYPDLTTPISPNKDIYAEYKTKFRNDVLDDNVVNSIQGNVKMDIDPLANLKFSTNFMVDYNESRRDLFYPKDFMETINYQSGYFSFSQRFIFSNVLRYNLDFDNSKLKFLAGTDYQQDYYSFLYARAYDGPNDYIKLNIVTGDSNKGDYLLPRGDLKVSRWNSKERLHMQSFYGSANYNYNDILDFKAVLRWDGASSIQRDSRWILSPGFSAIWKAGQTFEKEDVFNIRASYARIAIPNYDSKLAMGPQYSSLSLGWDEEPTISSYYGYVGLTRNYRTGWVGYNLDWAYSDKYELSLQKSFFKSRLDATVAVYQTYDRNQVVAVPVPGEFGYSAEYKNGLEVKNLGVDASLSAKIIDNKASTFKWNSVINFNINRNELTRLPNNLQELMMGDRLLQVGKPIDSYWLYQNIGIYEKDNDIPMLNGRNLNIDGLDFSVGDAKWKDLDNNGVIDNYDKVVQGRSTPKFFGGFINSFNYKNFQLDLNFVYALGHQALNQRASNRYNFVSNESSNSIYAVREVFHWQDDLDVNKYPIYNVWSNTNPYRLDQDLFLEDASYLKLRSVTLGYDISKIGYLKDHIKTLRKASVYITANNLFTVTPFSGNDPELINFNGYYDGYGLQFSRSFTLGIKLDL